jgi:hypothetical protein
MNTVTAIAVLAAIALLEPASQERFRTSAEAVRVDVLVKVGNRPLAGLTAADFDLRDRGVLSGSIRWPSKTCLCAS